MDKAAPAVDKLSDALDKNAAAQTKLAPTVGLTIAQHNALAKSLSNFATSAAESSLTLDQHTKIAKALGEAFNGLGKMATKSEKAILQDKIAIAQTALETPRLKKQLADLQKEMNPDKPKKFGVEFGNLFHTIAGFRSNDQGGLTFNIAEGIQGAVVAVERLAGAFAQVTGKALETAAAGEKATRATTLNLGATGGRDLLTYLDQVRDKSRGLYTQEQLRGLVAPLAQHGIGLSDTKRFLPAALSVEARGGSAAGALGALGDIRTNRSISAGTLDALGLGSFADKQKIASQLGSQFGFGGGYAKKNPEAVLGAVSERLQYQPQKADQVVKTLLAALAGREKGGVLGGDAAVGQQGTAATLQRLKNLPQTLYEKLSSSGQLDGLVKSLDLFVDVLTGPKGKGFIDGFVGGIDTLSILVTKISGWIGEKSAVDTITEAGGLAWTDKSGKLTDQVSKEEKYALAQRAIIGTPYAGRSVYGGDLEPSVVEQLARDQRHNELRDKKRNGLPDMAGGGVLVGGSGNQWGSQDIGKDLGKSIASGLVEGLLLSKASEGAMTTLMDNTFTAGEKEAEIHSPSRRAYRGGRFIGMGLALGIGDTQSQIDRAMDQAFAIDDVAGASRFNGGGGAGGGMGAGGGGMTLMIAAGAIRIDGAGMSAEDVAAEVLRQIEEKAPGAMISIAEQLSDELGGG